jgi:hypothetical protein
MKYIMILSSSTLEKSDFLDVFVLKARWDCLTLVTLRTIMSTRLSTLTQNAVVDALYSLPLHSLPLHSLPLHSLPLRSLSLHSLSLYSICSDPDLPTDPHLEETIAMADSRHPERLSLVVVLSDS